MTAKKSYWKYSAVLILKQKARSAESRGVKSSWSRINRISHPTNMTDHPIVPHAERTGSFG